MKEKVIMYLQWPSLQLFCETYDEEREYVIMEMNLPHAVKREKFFIKGKRVLCTV
jgi:energy-coupling factor transporter ATP-binding protein EcfA2